MSWWSSLRGIPLKWPVISSFLFSNCCFRGTPPNPRPHVGVVRAHPPGCRPVRVLLVILFFFFSVVHRTLRLRLASGHSCPPSGLLASSQSSGHFPSSGLASLHPEAGKLLLRSSLPAFGCRWACSSLRSSTSVRLRLTSVGRRPPSELVEPAYSLELVVRFYQFGRNFPVQRGQFFPVGWICPW